VGLRFSPPEAVGAVRLGVLGAWDWMFGETERDGLIPVGPGHDRINWAEGSVAAGVSVEVLPMLNVYGGASLVKPDIHLDVGGVESNLENDGVFGGFLGLGVKPNDAWTFGVESHFGNESTIGFSIEYFFGGRS
jgi:hypothetical protein